MGRIKTRFIKSISIQLVEQHKDKISTDFEKNKEVIGKILDIPSKKLRNVIAGYVTKLAKREQ